jgi:general secretion pathway protein F
MVEALALAGRATGSAWVGRLAEEESKAVRHGSSLADAIRRIPPLAAALPAWIQAGEASGSLEKLLETAGTAMQQRWNRFVTRTLSWLEPVLIFSVGAFVLLVVLSVLLPIVSLNKLIGG